MAGYTLGRRNNAIILTGTVLAFGVCLQGAEPVSNANATVTAVRFWSLGEATRVAIEVSSDFRFHSERLSDPDRLFFDIEGARPEMGKGMHTIPVGDSLLKQIRVAETQRGVTRIVLDLEQRAEFTASQLSNPGRLIIELRSRDRESPSKDRPAPDVTTISRSVTSSSAGSVRLLSEPVQRAAPPEFAAVATQVSVGASRTLQPISSDPGQSTNPEPRKFTPPRQFTPPPAAPPDTLARVEQKPLLLAQPTLAIVTRPRVPSGPPTTSPLAVIREIPPPVMREIPPPVVREIRPTVIREIPPSVDASISRLPVEPARLKDEPLRLPPEPVGVKDEPLKLKDQSVRLADPVKPKAEPVKQISSDSLPAADALPAKRNTTGDRSLTRVLGLKLARVVLDAGHGGHDVGTHGPSGLYEKDVVLDVTQRLGALLQDRLGSEIIYTRQDDTYVALEERTRIANAAKADLFLSIHANSSPFRTAAGVETYYLNFTTSRTALDVAARENASSERSIYDLQELLEKIALKDKIDESREFAARLQTALYSVSSKGNVAAKNRGIKKAPFVVLIGASMPSVLAEIGFLTNASDESLLRKAEQRQKIAEALYKGISSYADTLSHFTVAKRE